MAAEGLGVLWGLARTRIEVALADGVAVCAIVWCAAVTHSTIAVGPSSPLFVRAVHHPLPEGAHPADSFADIATTLRRIAPTEPIGVAFVFGPAYRALDLGFEARFVQMLSLIHISEPTRQLASSRMPSSA